MNGTVFPTAINHIQKKGIWIILGLFGGISVSISITDAAWVYFGVLP